MSFERAVRAERSPVNGAYRIGKQALENRHERLVICEDPQRLTGSLDSVLARHYANAARTVSAIGRRRKDGNRRSGSRSIRRRRGKRGQFSENCNGCRIG